MRGECVTKDRGNLRGIPKYERSKSYGEPALTEIFSRGGRIGEGTARRRGEGMDEADILLQEKNLTTLKRNFHPP